MNFSYEEINLMALYNTGNRERLIEVLTEMKTYLTLSETELRDLTDGTLDKLIGMTDAEFDELELYPDFICVGLSMKRYTVTQKKKSQGPV